MTHDDFENSNKIDMKRFRDLEDAFWEDVIVKVYTASIIFSIGMILTHIWLVLK